VAGKNTTKLKSAHLLAKRRSRPFGWRPRQVADVLANREFNESRLQRVGDALGGT